MANVRDIFLNIISRFRKKELDFGNADKVESYLSEVNDLKKEEFNKAMRVDSRILANDALNFEYKKIDAEVSQKIDEFFQGIIANSSEKYRALEGKEGFLSDGTPFKCYVEEESNKNMIITPKRAITIDELDNENGEYTETRETKPGNYATLNMKKVHGDIVSYNYYKHPPLSAEKMQKYKELKNYCYNPNNVHQNEIKGMNEQEKEAYMQELQKLGIANENYKSPEEMTKSEYEENKKEGKMKPVCNQSAYNDRGDFVSGGCIFSKEQEKPETIWVFSKPNGQSTQFKSFRKTEDGRYIDTTSFKMIDGKPSYKLLEYEEVSKEVEGFGINMSEFYKIRNKIENDLNGEFPKETQQISNNITQEIVNQDKIFHDNQFEEEK